MTNTPAAGSTAVSVRAATTHDVPGIKALVDIYAGKILLADLIDIYEALQEYVVVEVDGQIVGAEHYMYCGRTWESCEPLLSTPITRGNALAIRLSQRC